MLDRYIYYERHGYTPFIVDDGLFWWLQLREDIECWFGNNPLEFWEGTEICPKKVAVPVIFFLNQPWNGERNEST